MSADHSAAVTGKDEEPWIRMVLWQIANDEATNAKLLKDVLAAAP